jgi:hypothetical protein
MTALTVRRKGLSLPVWLGLAGVAVIMALLIAAIVHTMKHVKPVKSEVPPVSAVVWGDRVFMRPNGLALWLKARGIGYTVWAQRHPPANHLLQKQKAKLDRNK